MPARRAIRGVKGWTVLCVMALVAGATAWAAHPAPAVAAPSPQLPSGYLLVASDGGIYSLGTTNFGSMRGHLLTQPIVGGAATPRGAGYWLVASDGGVFTFGDAGFYGSTGGMRLNRPIVGMAATPSGRGYWLTASDGGVFTFGDAGFHGSTGGIRLDQPIVGIGGTPDGAGYWLVARDGGIFTFGDAPFRGSTGGHPGPAPIVGMAVSFGYPFAAGAIGYDVSSFSCGHLPTARSFAVVQVTGGSLSGSPNPCYTQEAAWAGPNESSYIFLDTLPSPAPAVSLTGPAGTCNGNLGCESYNYGWYWANHWVKYSQGLQVNPALWWLDVEVGYWSANIAANEDVVRGAVAGVRAAQGLVGVYSTSYQWPLIVGPLTFPGMPLWAAGAGNLDGSGGFPSPAAYCESPSQSFADGVITLVQYGWAPSQLSPFTDPDYGCL